VSFGKHGGKYQLRRSAWWWRRGDMGYHIAGDPVGHLLA
jgi:hypothetical protein